MVYSSWLAVLALCEQLESETTFKDIDSKYKVWFASRVW